MGGKYKNVICTCLHEKNNFYFIFSREMPGDSLNDEMRKSIFPLSISIETIFLSEIHPARIFNILLGIMCAVLSS